MLKAGIIDPAKVTRSALQNAASIAALFLTTEAVVADKPEKTPAAPAGARWRGHGLLSPSRRKATERPGSSRSGPFRVTESRPASLYREGGETIVL